MKNRVLFIILLFNLSLFAQNNKVGSKNSFFSLSRKRIEPTWIRSENTKAILAL